MSWLRNTYLTHIFENKDKGYDLFTAHMCRIVLYHTEHMQERKENENNIAE